MKQTEYQKNGEALIDLSKAPLGKRLKIQRIHPHCPFRSWLIGLGLLPGDEITVLNRAPTGSPLCLKNGSHRILALRDHEAHYIEVVLLADAP